MTQTACSGFQPIAPDYDRTLVLAPPRAHRVGGAASSAAGTGAGVAGFVQPACPSRKARVAAANSGELKRL